MHRIIGPHAGLDLVSCQASLSYILEPKPKACLSLISPPERLAQLGPHGDSPAAGALGLLRLLVTHSTKNSTLGEGAFKDRVLDKVRNYVSPSPQQHEAGPVLIPVPWVTEVPVGAGGHMKRPRSPGQEVRKTGMRNHACPTLKFVL